MPRNVHPTTFVIQPPADLLKQMPQLRRFSQQLSQKYAENLVVREEEIQAIGTYLWDVLQIQDALDAAREAAGNAVLPVVIESDSSEVQVLPWEILHHPAHGFLGRNPAFTLTRRIAFKEGIPALQKGPLRVLLFTSLPDDVHPERGRLNVEEEQAQIQEALLPWISKGLVHLEMPDDGRFATLKDYLKDFDPHVLFLSGHGKFNHTPHTGESYGIFLFEDEAGEGVAVRDDEIAKALVGANVQAVILSACESGKTASDALNNGLTARLSQQGIPHVIGMRESVLDTAGILFARTLCDELARRERVDIALQTARAAIQQPFSAEDAARLEAGGTAVKEQTFGQWCLPMLVSARPDAPLIDWDFPAVEMRTEIQLQRRSLSETVSLPARFVGRRSELRQHKNALLKGRLAKLLVTGPGGQGKTSLAGKLAQDLQKQGWQVFAWSARSENPWGDFELEMEMSLLDEFAKAYDRRKASLLNEPRKHAETLLTLLLQQYRGRVILFLDNLETLQDGETLAVKDAVVADWLEAAQHVDGLILLVTSRWVPPGWGGAHLPLERVSYADFLHIARLSLKREFWEQRERMKRVYEALGGNPRGLEFFASAALTMNMKEEDAFLSALTQAQADEQADMAIEAIYKHLPADARTLLARLPVYHEFVPAEGILKLAPDLPQPETALERLLAVSLLEAHYEPHWQATEYNLPPLVSDWMGEQGIPDAAPQWLTAAADYHLYLLQHERETLTQAVTAHHALRRAARHDDADRLTLRFIVGPLTRRGFYASLLSDWLPRICESKDLKTQAEALGQTGKILHHLGDFQNALPFMKQSLAIRQQIGDKAGEGTTLNNISQIFKAQGDYVTALDYLKQSLAIQRQIGDKAGEGTTLNNISQIYDAQGDYVTALDYLKQSLAIRQQIGDIKGESVTLNNISQILQVQGDYETALEYSKRDLAICQKIGDKAGMCVTLFNMGHMYAREEKIQEAVQAWVAAYVISKEINYFEILESLKKLAPQLGLPEGLAGWEELSQRIERGETIEFGQREEVSQAEQIRRFVAGLARAVKDKSEDAQKYFESVSKMASDPKAPPEFQELGKVLRDHMAGVKHLDLSKLPEELAKIVRVELGL